MSSHPIPYPRHVDVDVAADLCEERRRRALKTLTVADVLAQVDDLIASEPDATKHPCYAIAAWLLERQLTPLDGAALYDGWRRLCLDAVDRLVEARLQGED